MNYDQLINPIVQQIPPSGIRKFFDIAAEMKDCISLGVGEPDFVTPWNIPQKGHHLLYVQRRPARAAPVDLPLLPRAVSRVL